MKAPKLSGPGTLSEIEGFLDDITVPLRLAANSPEGWPVIASLWFEYHDGAFYCASKKHSRIVKLLQKKLQTGFEGVAEKPPYSGVRGQGVAVLGIQGGRQKRGPGCWRSTFGVSWIGWCIFSDWSQTRLIIPSRNQIFLGIHFCLGCRCLVIS